MSNGSAGYRIPSLENLDFAETAEWSPANLPDEAIAPSASMLETGVHFGYARVLMGSEQDREEERAQQALPMVMSIGWNPYYRNEKRTAVSYPVSVDKCLLKFAVCGCDIQEVHILHIFKHDFYGCELRIVMLGYIRPEYNYTSVETLIQDIETDKAVTLTSLERPAYEKYLKDPFFT